MKPQNSHGEQEWWPQGGGQGGSQEPSIIHQPEGDHLHLESVLGGHAAEHALLEGRVDDRPQDAEISREEAGIVPIAVVLLPAVRGMEGAHRAGQKDRGVGLHHHFFGGCSTQLQSYWRVWEQKWIHDNVSINHCKYCQYCKWSQNMHESWWHPLI